MANNFEGKKYDGKRSEAELKEAILGHLKTLVPAGARVTLRANRGVGTLSLDATVANLPLAINSPEYLKLAVLNPETVYNGSRYSPEVSALNRLLEHDAEEFGFDKSDSMTDYYHRAFYFNAHVNAAEEVAERNAFVFAASPKRAAIEKTILAAIQVYEDTMKEGEDKGGSTAAKTVRFNYWGNADMAAAQIDKATGSNVRAKISELKKNLAAAEDWNQAAGIAAQAAFVAAKKKAPVKAKPAAEKKPTEKQIAKRVEAAYYRKCSGIAINIMDIGKVFAEGRKIVETGVTDAELADQLNAFVQTIRVDDTKQSIVRGLRDPALTTSSSQALNEAVKSAQRVTVTVAAVPASYESALDSLIAEVRKGPKQALVAAVNSAIARGEPVVTEQLSPQKRAWVTRRARESAKAAS